MMPTSKTHQQDPRPTVDPKPSMPESTPLPIGDPKPAVPKPDPQPSKDPCAWEILAPKKVDDISRHESKQGEKYTPKPNAREEPLGWVKPDGPQIVRSVPDGVLK
jgi:hypothetical protein